MLTDEPPFARGLRGKTSELFSPSEIGQRYEPTPEVYRLVTRGREPSDRHSSHALRSHERRHPSLQRQQV